MFELTPFVRRNHLSSYDPFRDFDALERAFFSTPSQVGFQTDILEKKNNYVLEAELPGFRKEDISLDVDGDYLTITAKNETDCNDYVRRERRCGTFTRAFDISSVKADEITATYENGMLIVTLPKKDEAVVTQRKIDIQ